MMSAESAEDKDSDSSPEGEDEGEDGERERKATVGSSMLTLHIKVVLVSVVLICLPTLKNLSQTLPHPKVRCPAVQASRQGHLSADIVPPLSLLQLEQQQQWAAGSL